MIGQTTADQFRGFLASFADLGQEVGERDLTTGNARAAAGAPNPTFYIRAGGAVRCNNRWPEIHTGKILTKVSSKNSDECDRIGKRDVHGFVKTAGTHECRVETLRIIAGGDHYHAFPLLESVELLENGVDDAGPPIVAVTSGTASGQCVDFIDKQYRRGVLARGGKGVTNRAGDRTQMAVLAGLPLAITSSDEIYVCGFCQCLCEQGLTSARRSGYEDSSTDRSPRDLAF